MRVDRGWKRNWRLFTQSHGKVHEAAGFPPIIATLHPSAILRARTDEDRQRDTKLFMDDLRRVTDFLKK